MTARDRHEPDAHPDDDTAAHELSRVVVALLRGVVERDDDPAAWHALWAGQDQVRDYVAVLGLALVLDHEDGYAFLRALPDPAPDAPRPRLMERRPLSYPVSLTLVLLRKALAAFETSGASGRLVLTRDEIAELLRSFLPSGGTEAKLIDMVDSHVSKVAELGFLRKLAVPPDAPPNSQTYEVRRVLKAFVDAQWLTEFDARLEAYQTQLSGTSTERARGGNG